MQQCYVVAQLGHKGLLIMIELVDYVYWLEATILISISSIYDRLERPGCSRQVYITAGL